MLWICAREMLTRLTPKRTTVLAAVDLISYLTLGLFFAYLGLHNCLTARYIGVFPNTSPDRYGYQRLTWDWYQG